MKPAGCNEDPETGSKHHLHRKTQVLPCELKKANAFLISRSDLQCFSHEDGCFAPVSEVLEQPALTVSSFMPKVLPAYEHSAFHATYSATRQERFNASITQSAGVVLQKKAAAKSARQPFLNMRCPPPLFQYYLPAETTCRVLYSVTSLTIISAHTSGDIVHVSRQIV